MIYEERIYTIKPGQHQWILRLEAAMDGSPKLAGCPCRGKAVPA